MAEETAADADAGNTPNPLLFHLERNFGAVDPDRRPPGDGLVLLRSAGERGEAEAIAVEAAKLIAAGSDPAEIAIALRDPARRGPPIAEVLESYGVADRARGRGAGRRDRGRRRADRAARSGVRRRAR